MIARGARCAGGGLTTRWSPNNLDRKLSTAPVKQVLDTTIANLRSPRPSPSRLKPVFQP